MFQRNHHHQESHYNALPDDGDYTNSVVYHLVDKITLKLHLLQYILTKYIHKISRLLVPALLTSHYQTCLYQQPSSDTFHLTAVDKKV
jgi:hypothetical protein